MAEHATRLLHCHHLSVRSNVIKSLCPHSPAFLYDHWACHCAHPQLLALRAALLQRHREDLIALSLHQQDLAAALLELFRNPDGFRVAQGNFSHAQGARLFPLYLDHPGSHSSRDELY